MGAPAARRLCLGCEKRATPSGCCIANDRRRAAAKPVPSDYTRLSASVSGRTIEMLQSGLDARFSALRLAFALALPLGLASIAAQAERANKVLPMPAADISTPASDLQTASFAGGCFWGVQAIFQHVDGVDNAVSG